MSGSTNGDATNGNAPAGSGNGSSPSADGSGDGAKPAMVKPPQGEQRNFGPRPMLGVPMEKSEDFKNSSLRLANRLRPEWWRVLLVVVLAVTSVTMTVFGPKILGHATNIIVAGVFGAASNTVSTWWASAASAQPSSSSSGRSGRIAPAMPLPCSAAAKRR